MSYNFLDKSGLTYFWDKIKGKFISFTSSNQSVAGTTKTVSKVNPETLYIPNGLIMGGTAQAAGLVTRGICGIGTPDNNGACSKENLYINYDGNNTFNANRQIVSSAGTIGNHLGSNMYQYTLPRGEVVKNWVEAKGYTTNTGTVTSVAVKMNNTTKGTVTTSGTIDLGTVITSHQDISGLAPKASPTFTGTPKAPTATAGTNTTQIATTAFVQTAVSGKVDKETGKGLSTNDYTTTEKNKLAGIAEGATAVTVDSAWSDTSTNPIQNKMIKEALTHFQGELSELEENAQQAISGLDSSKAPKASPTFTGTPKAPTATAGTNTTQIATTAFVQTATSGKVDKVTGKGLSTNDYTTTEKNKLAGIATGATANTGTVTSVSVKMNGSTKGTVTTSGTIDLGTVITTVDDELDSAVSATNPVQNWVISTAIDALDGEISETYESIPQIIYSRLNSSTISSATIDSIVNGTYGS